MIRTASYRRNCDSADGVKEEWQPRTVHDIHQQYVYCSTNKRDHHALVEAVSNYIS